MPLSKFCLRPHHAVNPLVALVMLILVLSGCGGQGLMNRPSVAELNQKAQLLLSQGDATSAIGRLESALDLDPNQPNTLFNLAIAYQQTGKQNKAIPLLEKLLTTNDRPGPRLPAEVEDNVRQALSVAYEAQADTLAPVADPLSSPASTKPIDAATLQQARDLRQKALTTLSQGSAKLRQQPNVQAHCQQLEASLKQPS
jgi:tetratricopeptide (TPR) repeat protein